MSPRSSDRGGESGWEGDRSESADSAPRRSGVGGYAQIASPGGLGYVQQAVFPPTSTRAQARAHDQLATPAQPRRSNVSSSLGFGPQARSTAVQGSNRGPPIGLFTPPVVRSNHTPPGARRGVNPLDPSHIVNPHYLLSESIATPGSRSSSLTQQRNMANSGAFRVGIGGSELLGSARVNRQQANGRRPAVQNQSNLARQSGGQGVRRSARTRRPSPPRDNVGVLARGPAWSLMGYDNVVPATGPPEVILTQDRPSTNHPLLGTTGLSNDHLTRAAGPSNRNDNAGRVAENANRNNITGRGAGNTNFINPASNASNNTGGVVGNVEFTNPTFNANQRAGNGNLSADSMSLAAISIPDSSRMPGSDSSDGLDFTSSGSSQMQAPRFANTGYMSTTGYTGNTGYTNNTNYMSNTQSLNFNPYQAQAHGTEYGHFNSNQNMFLGGGSSYMPTSGLYNTGYTNNNQSIDHNPYLGNIGAPSTGYNFNTQQNVFQPPPMTMPANQPQGENDMFRNVFGFQQNMYQPAPVTVNPYQTHLGAPSATYDFNSPQNMFQAAPMTLNPPQGQIEFPSNAIDFTPQQNVRQPPPVTFTSPQVGTPSAHYNLSSPQGQTDTPGTDYSFNTQQEPADTRTAGLDFNAPQSILRNSPANYTNFPTDDVVYTPPIVEPDGSLRAPELEWSDERVDVEHALHHASHGYENNQDSGNAAAEWDEDLFGLEPSTQYDPDFKATDMGFGDTAHGGNNGGN